VIESDAETESLEGLAINRVQYGHQSNRKLHQNDHVVLLRALLVLDGGKNKKKRSTALDPIRYSPHLLPPPRNLRLLLPDSANPNPNPRPTFDPHLATLFLLVCSGLC